jgi:predicted transcriptional regulator
MYSTAQDIIYKQFPMRLEISLARELDHVAKESNINKTTLSRIAIQKFLKEMRESGAVTSIANVCEV